MRNRYGLIPSKLKDGCFLAQRKRQRVYSEFDSAVEREGIGFSEFLEIHGANLLKKTAAMVTTAMALFVGR